MSGARRESTPERPMGDVLEFAGVVAVITGGVMVWRLTNVWIRRLSRPPESGGDLVEVQRHLHELEEQVEQQHGAAEARLVEVEERLDFAERILGQQRDRSALPRPPE